MNRSFRKFVTILMLLWLPLFSGNALAVSVSMQMAQGACHEAAASLSTVQDDMAQHHHHGEKPVAADEQSTSCSSCGVCHLACSGYLAAPDMTTIAAQNSASEIIFYLVSFISITSTPLVPPPLTRA